MDLVIVPLWVIVKVVEGTDESDEKADQLGGSDSL
jgi:hypothetical protein